MAMGKATAKAMTWENTMSSMSMGNEFARIVVVA